MSSEVGEEKVKDLRLEESSEYKVDTHLKIYSALNCSFGAKLAKKILIIFTSLQPIP